MKNQSQQEKDFYLLAKKIKNEQKQHEKHNLDIQLQERYKKQSQEALKMINAYRKVENVKTKDKAMKNNDNQTQTYKIQPKSNYANKIKQTLRELNANKAKQYEKISQKNQQLKSEKNINSIQVNNQMNLKKRQDNQKKLILKSTQKIFLLLNSFRIKKLRSFLKQITLWNEDLIENDFKMARKYRLFRLFSLWKQEVMLLKIKNQKCRIQTKEKQFQGMEMAKQFYIFKTTKKVLKYWSKVVKSQRKKRKYDQQLRKIQIQSQLNQNQNQNIQQKETTANAQLQNKLRGFLDGLKQKIQNKQPKRLNAITQISQESQQTSQVFSQNPNLNQNHEQNNNLPENQQHQEGQQADVNNQQNQNENLQQQNQAQQKHLTNQELQKRRKQIYERSKNRKQALQKIKKEKQQNRKKQQEERRQLEKKIDQEQKKIKQLKYKQYQERKKLQKEWQQRQKQLNKKAQQWNRLRLMNHYGFENWRILKKKSQQNVEILNQKITKIMIKHAGSQLFQNLSNNLDSVLEILYEKMRRFHQRNLKKNGLEGFKQQYRLMSEQKPELEAFHQVHSQKIYLYQWKQILDLLRLENIEQQKPLLKKATQYHKISLLLKSLKFLKQNSVQNKKAKNINQQKQKIKSKIKNIISQKIQINYDDFL